MSLFSDASFFSAQENMAYDVSQLNLTRVDQKTRFRIYEWPQFSVTYPHRAQLDSELYFWDRSARPTGGGLLFHMPTDLVWSCSARIDAPDFPSVFKAKLRTCSTWIFQTFLAFGLEPEVSILAPGDTQFCNTYFSPFEHWVAGHKLSGMAIRRYKEYFLIQGILHLNTREDTVAWQRKIPSEYRPYLSTGLDKAIDRKALRSALFRNWEIR